jgi:hypothetical protein
MKRIGKLLLKVLLAVLLVAVIGGAVWVFLNWTDLKAFQGMPSGAYAKFMCSSLFVEGKPIEQARTWSQVSVPVQEISIDYTNKSVTARSLFFTNTARYINDRFGCTLD